MIRSSLLVGAIVVLTGSVFAGDVDLEDVKCLMNPRAAAKPETAVEYKDAHVYFCCNNCKGKFEESPEDFALKANHQLVATEQFEQTACPISGNAVNPEKTVELGGTDVAFCCDGCKGKVESAEGEEQLELIFSEDAFEKGFAKVEEDDDQ